MKKGKKAYVIRDWSKGEIKEFMDLVDKSDGVWSVAFGKRCEGSC